MSDTTRSKSSPPISSSARSAVGAGVTAQPFAVKAETRKRSSEALSSTASTRSVEDAVISPFPSFAGRHLVEELHPLAREHAIIRELQPFETLRHRLRRLPRRRRRRRLGRAHSLRRAAELWPARDRLPFGRRRRDRARPFW